jgi:outer membrane protein OmpA-like peptidoglycan-associated protein
MKPLNLNQWITILCCIVLPEFNVHAQGKNLVLNPGFEIYEKCPENYTSHDRSHKLIPSWSYPTFDAPDYFNRCSPGAVKVPNNFAGQSQPHGGDGYMGSILTGTEYNYREYFQGTLSKPLEKDKRYCVSFYYKLASYSKFAVDNLSVFFSTTEVKVPTSEKNLPLEPQLNNKPGLFLDNIDEWERYCQVYIASGHESFFVIGNFKNYDHTNYVVTDRNAVNLRNKSYAYYFFDDFSIFELENCNDCPCVPHSMDVALIDSSYTGGFDPRTGVFKGKKDDGKITLAIRGGTPPYEVQWSNNMKGTNLKNLPAGTYTYKAFDLYHCNATGTIFFKEPEIPAAALDDGLKNIEEGTAIVLKNIFFEYNKTTLLPASFIELNKVVEFMKESGVQLIEIGGHTDSDGSDAYNKTLSQGRAKAVVDYLVSQGIDPKRLRAMGYGESKPIETNKSDGGKAVNRRVEFFLVKK